MFTGISTFSHARAAGSPGEDAILPDRPHEATGCGPACPGKLACRDPGLLPVEPSIRLTESVKIILDLLPVIVFFGAYWVAKHSPQLTQAWVTPLIGPVSVTAAGADLGAMVFATLCCMAATLVQIGWLLARRARVPPAVWISAGLVLVMGGLTVWFKNDGFIKWKPTLLYWAFAATLAAGQWILRKNLLGALFSNELELPPAVWDRLSVAWMIFFASLGALNLVVAYHFSNDLWVTFKAFGTLGLTLAFSVCTAFYVVRYVKAPDA